MQNKKIVKQAIIQLLKDWGISVTVHRFLTESINYQTGARRKDVNQFLIKAIVLPLSEYMKNISFGTGRDNFGYGGTYTLQDRVLITQNFVLQDDDVIEYNSMKYEIIELDSITLDLGSMAILRAVK